MQSDRLEDLQSGIRLEIVTVFWMIVEAALALGSGIAAGSVLLAAFGIDSVIELVSGGILLWRLWLEARGEETERVEAAERRAAAVVAITLALLCVYVLVSAILGLVRHFRPEASPVGIAVSLAAVIVMPWLATSKRRVAARIDSDALEGDAAESVTCAYMAGTVLLGLLTTALLGWWWAEHVAALLFLFWLARETREAFEEARGE
jgi:divalent metal cation (Fe/Co/Zn/Cd) transporter